MLQCTRSDGMILTLATSMLQNHDSSLSQPEKSQAPATSRVELELLAYKRSQNKDKLAGRKCQRHEYSTY